jgi:hypothetical protein
MSKFKALPKILVYDIETAPILANVWRIWGENVGLNQIERDWCIIAWSAKWLHDPENKIMYMDQRRSNDIEQDQKIVEKLWALIDEADIVITHNGKKFDQKKINARFLYHGMKPPSPVKHIDTCEIAYKQFGFTSNKLEFLTDKLNTKYKKSKHKKFPGFELWKECLSGNKEAWREMEKYNKYDVLALEELYYRLAPWTSINFTIYQDVLQCKCGSVRLVKRGFQYTPTRKYQRYCCLDCGHWTRDTKCMRSSARAGCNRE